MTARQQAFRDITEEPIDITYNEVGNAEVWSVRVSHLVQRIFINKQL